MRRSARAICSSPASVTSAALAVYEKIDYIKVTPSWGMAPCRRRRCFPKMLVRFEAVAWSHGADGKPDTKDDLDLGAVDATWSLEEYTATFDDDDVKFVGEIDRIARRVHAGGGRARIRSAPAIATTSATSGSSLCISPASAARRCAPARISSSPSRSTCGGTFSRSTSDEPPQPRRLSPVRGRGRRYLYLAPSAAVMAIDDVVGRGAGRARRGAAIVRRTWSPA